MEKLKQMKECLVGMVEGQIYGNIDKVDAQELGAAVDMIKDLSEALYYCSITEAMEEEGKEDKEGKGKHGMMYYPRTTPMYHMPYPYPVEMYDPRYRERYNSGSMYAQGGNSGNSGSSGNGGNSSGGNNARGGGSRGYHEGMMPMYDDGMMYNSNYTMYERGGNRNYSDMMKDPREGRSGERRKMYMEGKGMKDKTHQMKELENYMQELTSDLTEMIQDASPEEKQLLQQKISTLATKIK